MYRHKEHLDKKKISLVGFISFLMGFAQATVLYVVSTYFKEASGTENVGLFYIISYGVILLTLFNFHKIIKKFGQSTVFYFALFFKILTIIFLLNFDPSWLGIGFLILYIIFGQLEWVALDVIIESFSTDNMSGRIRGKHLTVLNLGYLLGPFLSTRILDNYDFFGIFLFLFIFNSIIFIVSLVGLRQVNHKFKDNVTVLGLIRKVAKRKNVLRIYYVSFVLEFFYASAVIYTTIYLLDIGVTLSELGYIFTAMLLPFVLLQYPLGIIADKKTGEKEFLIVAIVILAMATTVIYFVSSTSILIWSIVLFSTRIGAAILEIMRDSYFYKRIDGADVDLINFFRTASSTAHIAAAVMSAITLLLFPLPTVFLFTGIVILSALYPAFKLVDNRSEREKSMVK